MVVVDEPHILIHCLLLYFKSCRRLVPELGVYRWPIDPQTLQIVYTSQVGAICVLKYERADYDVVKLLTGKCER